MLSQTHASLSSFITGDMAILELPVIVPIELLQIKIIELHMIRQYSSQVYS